MIRLERPAGVDQSGSMVSKRLWGVAGLIVLLLAMLTASACGKQETSSETPPSPSQSSSPEASASSEEAQTQTIKHYYGETEVPLHPQRVAVIGHEDIALSLNAPLVYAYGFDGYYLYDRLKALNIPLSESSDLNLNFEAILAAKPDLIILQGYFTDEQGYEKLNKIAPTIAFKPDDWKGNIVVIGQVLGLESKAKEVVAAYEDELKQAQEAIAATAGSKNTVAFLRPSDKEIQVFFPSFAPLIYDEVGLIPDASIDEFKKKADGDWGINASLEELPKITADYVFAIYGGSISPAEEYEKENAAAIEVEKLQVWKAMPAVKNDRVFKVSARTWMSSGPIANSSVIDDIKAAVVGSP